MALMNGYTSTPHHRQNRRRERPGSRTRRTISRKSHIQSSIDEGLLDARDLSVPLPSDKTRPSPLLRQNFDQSWQRWKAKQAEEKALAEMDRMQLEQELFFFGGEVDDDELYRMGILYRNDEDVAQDFHSEESNTILCSAPVEQSPPTFVIRPSKRSRRRRPAWRSGALPLHLSFNALSDDADIVRLISTSTIQHRPTIQHRHPKIPSASDIEFDIPQSLPPLTTALESLHGSIHNSPISLPSANHDFNSGDWTFVTYTPIHTPQPDNPLSETETWVLCDDS